MQLSGCCLTLTRCPANVSAEQGRSTEEVARYPSAAVDWCRRPPQCRRMLPSTWSLYWCRDVLDFAGVAWAPPRLDSSTGRAWAWHSKPRVTPKPPSHVSACLDREVAIRYMLRQIATACQPLSHSQVAVLCMYFADFPFQLKQRESSRINASKRQENHEATCLILCYPAAP